MVFFMNDNSLIFIYFKNICTIDLLIKEYVKFQLGSVCFKISYKSETDIAKHKH